MSPTPNSLTDPAPTYCANELPIDGGITWCMREPNHAGFHEAYESLGADGSHGECIASWSAEPLSPLVVPQAPEYERASVALKPSCHAIKGVFACTRVRGHGGPHVAHGTGGKQLAQWDESDAEDGE